MKNITCKDFLLKYYNNSNFVIIDLRNPKDFNNFHIPNSYNIPYQSFVSKYAYYLNHSNIYFLICEGGENSKKAASLLSKNNYNVINISDGIKSWKGPIIN